MCTETSTEFFPIPTLQRPRRNTGQSPNRPSWGSVEETPGNPLSLPGAVLGCFLALVAKGLTFFVVVSVKRKFHLKFTHRTLFRKNHYLEFLFS